MTVGDEGRVFRAEYQTRDSCMRENSEIAEGQPSGVIGRVQISTCVSYLKMEGGGRATQKD